MASMFYKPIILLIPIFRYVSKKNENGLIVIQTSLKVNEVVFEDKFRQEKWLPLNTEYFLL